MRAVVDTSAIVTAVLDGATAQAECARAIRDGDAAASGHAWFESVSVLTRMPPDVRLSTSEAYRTVERAVSGTRLLSAKEQTQFRTWLATSEVAGGSIYDALVGWVAKVADVPLITRDQRALPTYRRLGIEVFVIAPTLE
jgi:uncharacterized protein with PIN domain